MYRHVIFVLADNEDIYDKFYKNFDISLKIFKQASSEIALEQYKNYIENSFEESCFYISDHLIQEELENYIFKIRAINPFTQIVIMSEDDRISKIINDIKSGADDYLKLPFDKDQLLFSVRKSFERIANRKWFNFKSCNKDLLFTSMEERFNSILEKEKELLILGDYLDIETSNQSFQDSSLFAFEKLSLIQDEDSGFSLQKLKKMISYEFSIEDEKKMKLVSITNNQELMIKIMNVTGQIYENLFFTDANIALDDFIYGKFEADILILDQASISGDFLQFIANFKIINRDLGVIVIGGCIHQDTIIDSFQKGATDYLIRPVFEDELEKSIESVAKNRYLSSDLPRMLDLFSEKRLSFDRRINLMENYLKKQSLLGLEFVDSKKIKPFLIEIAGIDSIFSNDQAQIFVPTDLRGEKLKEYVSALIDLQEQRVKEFLMKFE